MTRSLFARRFSGCIFMSEIALKAQSIFSGLTDISDLAVGPWCDSIRAVCDQLGEMEQIGKSHTAAYLEVGDTLLVGFDSYEGALDRSPTGYPMSMVIAAQNGWSSLSLIATDRKGDAPWFRGKAVYEYFDQLVEEAFFDGFDRVVFYGAGAAGHAAAAYSVTAPGATVVLVSPQATLNGRLSEWDGRHRDMRRADFTTRYGFAPYLIDGCETAAIIYDPLIKEDAMHAAMFTREHVLQIPFRHSGDDPELELIEMGGLEPLLRGAMAGDLSTSTVASALRARRTHMGYLRGLYRKLAPESTLMRNLICRHILRQHPNAPNFRETYRQTLQVLLAERQLDGIKPFGPKDDITASVLENAQSS